MNTNELYLKKYKGVETGIDYVNWAICEVENGIENITLYELSSLGNNANYFEAFELFNKLLNDGIIVIPTEKECTLYRALMICEDIVQNTENLFNKAKELFYLCVELEYDSCLMDWYWVNEDIDALTYDKSRSDLTRKSIEVDIFNKAKEFIKLYIKSN